MYRILILFILIITLLTKKRFILSSVIQMDSIGLIYTLYSNLNNLNHEFIFLSQNIPTLNHLVN